MSCTFVHISDTHLGPDANFTVRDMNLYERTAATIDVINDLSESIDFVLHTGDVCNNTSLVPQGVYPFAKQVFSRLKVPIYFAAGNHDLGHVMKKELTFPKTVSFVPGTERLDYRFEEKGVNFVVLDARIGECAKGLLVEDQFALVRRVASENKPMVIVVHYVPVDFGIEWYREFNGTDGPDTMFIENGSTLHDILANECSPGQVRGVLLGHVHANHAHYRDGILYSSVSSTGFQFQAWPEQKGREVIWDMESPPGYQIVHLEPAGVTITQRKVLMPFRSQPASSKASGWKKSVA